MTTLEDRRRCPKCSEPGMDAGAKIEQNRSTTFTMQCENNRCRWWRQRWVYSVRQDGTLVEPSAHRPKNYPALPGNGEAFLNALDREIGNSMPQ